MACVVTLCALSLCTSGTALAADAIQECSAAYVSAQQLRVARQLRRAREQLLVCAREACPSSERADCARWLEETEASLPSVVIEVHDRDGRSTTLARIVVDGQLLAERSDGKAIFVDPGPHHFRYEMAGASPIERDEVILEGEKNRKLSVSFAPAGPTMPTTEVVATPATSAPPAPQRSSTPVGAYVLSGVGVVALGTFVALALSGKSDERELDSTCHTRCQPGQVDTIRHKYLFADLSLAVSLVSFGVGGYLAFSRGDEPARAGSVGLGVRGGRDGGFGTLRGSF